MIIEVCAGSVTDCLIAEEAGANRIELNAGLHLGGLTPSYGTFKLAIEKCKLPIISMVRPRGAGFHYNELEVMSMFTDARYFLEHGAAGIAFGFLNEQGKIEEELTRQMIELCHAYGKEAVFHRAFDVTPDLDEACKTLIRLQCDRILTSGGEETVEHGKSMLKSLLEKYQNEIEFCLGSGVNEDNILPLHQVTGANQFHGSFKTWYTDVTTSRRTVDYSYAIKDMYEETDLKRIKEIVSNIQSNNK